MLDQAFFKRMGYLESRQLNDGSWVALVQLLFTTGICMGLNEVGWSKRYCFDDIERCRKEYEKLQSVKDVPEGWIAKRPE